MSKKRVSLAEIQNEEINEQLMEPVQIVVEEKIIPKTDIRQTKSEFTKVSITIPPGMFERLLDISRERRRAKQPHTISDLVREALTLWPNMRSY